MISKHLVSTVIAIPILYILKHLANAFPYTQQGWFCDDDEIRYPFRENTIGSDSMLKIIAIVSILLFLSGEYSLIRHLTRKGRRVVVQAGKLHPFINSSFICSSLATIVTTTFAKRIVCRLRPNFLAVCQPDLNKLCTPDAHLFIQNYECLGRFDDDEFYSFPSGHSSSAANFAVFMIIYLQKRCKFHELIRSFIQFFIFLFSVFVWSSRVRDYKHRLSDVLGGAVLGGLFAIYFVTHVLRNFRSHWYELRAYDESETESRFGQLLLPTIVVDPSEKSAAPSDYGSLDDGAGSSR
ncbi:AcidPPc domain-containing protein [Aphelenchoides besseyi]|nr:AcidPPc domain-containing protein [Aphelenchoides besseyi]KAI6209706.1 AcidPPc domain-containing protein [Aphelenchoides besseyi]